MPPEHLTWMKGVFPFFWGDGYANPPSYYAGDAGMDADTLGDRLSGYVSEATIGFYDSGEAERSGAPKRGSNWHP